jgi:hypothetical protein
MYCVKCGVKLADTEVRCPLCGTRVFHPDIFREEGESLYPKRKLPKVRGKNYVMPVLFTAAFVLPFIIVLLSDIQFNSGITWSGYVVGALLVLYAMFVLPGWFRKPNPVIFVPVSFGAIALFLLYVCLATGGSWFLPLAFPVTGFLCLLVTTVVVLTRYVRKGLLYVFGGASLAMGGFMVLLEYLLHITFHLPGVGTWSFYPLIVFFLLGAALILIAIVPSFRESLSRKFFI